MGVLELETEEEGEEMESLMKEVQDAEQKWGGTMRHRQGFATVNSLEEGNHGEVGSWAASVTSAAARLVERNRNFTARHAVLLGCLGVMVILFLHTVNRTVERMEHVMEQEPPHQSSFGGLQNSAQPAGAKALKRGISFQVPLPVSNVGHAIPSLTQQNVQNVWGHYVHDEFRSPYASHLYDRTPEALSAEQDTFMHHMEQVRKKWGAWSFVDRYDEDFRVSRPRGDVHATPYRDVFLDDFPPEAWQNDPQYMNSFFSEAKDLVNRMKEGIYAEYGHGTKKKNGNLLKPAEQKIRDELFSVNREEGKNAGIAFMDQHSWDGLVRKLLHAMVTNDEFYVVLGGHSAAAGHGNNFLQSYMMAFHYIMEPVFDKLGMRLVTRNMAQERVGTTISAMGGGSIYGETDVLLWDSSLTEKELGAIELFHVQGILSGERAPVLLTPHPEAIMERSNGTAWVGTLSTQGTDHICKETVDETQVKTLPWACQYVKCTKERADLCINNRYNSVCWVDRNDVEPVVEQRDVVSGQAGLRPGWRVHQMEGRKISMLMLHALDAALDQWQEALEVDGYPLDPFYWHVGPAYEDMKDKVRTYRKTQVQEDGETEEVVPTACEELFHEFPIVCRVVMKAHGEWTPRINPEATSLRSLIPNVQVLTEEVLYEGIDVYPPQWKIPDGHVDVHAIAVATKSPPPILDHSWNFQDEADAYNYDDVYDDAFGDDFMVNYNYNQNRMLHKNKEQTVTGMMEEEQLEKAAPLKDERLKIWSDKYGASGKAIPLDVRHSLEHEEEENTVVLNRNLGNTQETIVPGRGWVFFEQVTGTCDGSAQSDCGHQTSSDCLMSGHNDAMGGIYGDALSGWLVLTVPKVKEGVILLRMENWVDPIPKDWTDVNDGKPTDTKPYFTDSPTGAPTTQPTIKPTPQQQQQPKQSDEKEEEGAGGQRHLAVPKDGFFEFDIAVNGNITTYSRDEFLSVPEIVKNMALWPALLDESMSQRKWKVDDEGETFEVAIRIRSDKGRDATVRISHVYYA